MILSYARLSLPQIIIKYLDCRRSINRCLAYFSRHGGRPGLFRPGRLKLFCHGAGQWIVYFDGVSNCVDVGITLSRSVNLYAPVRLFEPVELQSGFGVTPRHDDHTAGIFFPDGKQHGLFISQLCSHYQFPVKMSLWRFGACQIKP